MRLAQTMLVVVFFFSLPGANAFGQSPSLSTVIDNLNSTDGVVRLSAARDLPTVWQTAANRQDLVRQLAPLLSSPDAHVRLSVLATFEQMVFLHPEEAAAIANSKPALLKAIDDPSEDVRQYGTAVLALVQPATDEDLKRVVLRGLADPSHKVRRVALGAVSFKKLNEPEVVAATLALPPSWPGELSQKIKTLGEVAPTSPGVIEFFVSSLSESESDVKSQALLGLSKSGKGAAEALPKLRQLAADPHESEQVKKLASEAIKKIQ